LHLRSFNGLRIFQRSARPLQPQCFTTISAWQRHLGHVYYEITVPPLRVQSMRRPPFVRPTASMHVTRCRCQPHHRRPTPRRTCKLVAPTVGQFNRVASTRTNRAHSRGSRSLRDEQANHPAPITSAVRHRHLRPHPCAHDAASSIAASLTRYAGSLYMIRQALQVLANAPCRRYSPQETPIT